MAVPPPITPEAVAHLRSLPTDGDRNQYVAQLLFMYFGFNDEWFAKHVRPKGMRNLLGFFRLRPDLGNSPQVTGRLCGFAENLWNLSEPTIHGFPEALAGWQDKAGEGEFNEVLLAANLKRWTVPFWFHINTDGYNYDFDAISVGGDVVAVEAKSRETGLVRNWAKLRNNKMGPASRNQLPCDRPGSIFVQIPEEWVSGDLSDMQREIGGLFSSNSRVVSVVFFWITAIPKGNDIQNIVSYWEFKSAVHKFDKSKKWDIFGQGRPQSTDWMSLQSIRDYYLNGRF